jgi:transcriptional regulator with XRE-family HTH domain
MTKKVPGRGTFGKPKMYPPKSMSFSARAGYETGMKNNIEKLRRARGLKQHEVAEKIGTTPQYYGKLERSDKPLHDEWIAKIAGALGVEPYQLLMTGMPITAEAQPTPEHQFVRLSVALPNVETLTEMFEALLALADEEKDLVERARTLAEYLPNALQLASASSKNRSSYLKNLAKAARRDDPDSPAKPEQ